VLLAGAQVSEGLHSRRQRSKSPATHPSPIRIDRGSLVPQPNYRQAKKLKEASRMARQLEKQQRRTARTTGSGEILTPLPGPDVGPNDPILSAGT